MVSFPFSNQLFNDYPTIILSRGSGRTWRNRQTAEQYLADHRNMCGSDCSRSHSRISCSAQEKSLTELSSTSKKWSLLPETIFQKSKDYYKI